MTLTTIVMAFLFQFIPDPNTGFILIPITTKKMTLEKCMENAKQINEDPSNDFFMLCKPITADENV